MSGNDQEQNIINGEAPKESYYKHKKKGTNYSKRVQKELNNTELKLNLNTLALELGKQKAINKPLQNKIAKLVCPGAQVAAAGEAGGAWPLTRLCLSLSMPPPGSEPGPDMVG